jgi:hypothetical protein
VAAFAFCLVVGLLWYSQDDLRLLLEDLLGEQPAPAEVIAPVQSGPRYPVQTPITPEADNSDVDPLPPLAESDSYSRALLNEVFGTSLNELLASSGLIIKLVATVDGMTAAKLQRNVWPLGARLGAFKVVVVEDDTSSQIYMGPDNHARFDFLVTLATSPDPTSVADAYRQVYPLLQEAYVELGYPDGYFNDRLVEVIDHLLNTPAAAAPIKLVRPHVLYEYADPELAALSGGQQLLLRIGSDNTAKLKQWLQAFRDLIVQTQDQRSN